MNQALFMRAPPLTLNKIRTCVAPVGSGTVQTCVPVVMKSSSMDLNVFPASSNSNDTRLDSDLTLDVALRPVARRRNHARGALCGSRSDQSEQTEHGKEMFEHTTTSVTARTLERAKADPSP